MPSVFLIAETSVNYEGLEEALTHIGAPDWRTEADSDASALCEFAGKSCYMSFDKSLNKNLTATGTKDNHEYIQTSIIKQRHGSVLEHATVTFFITEVSRVFTHELVRHRAGTAFSQTSNRYVRTNDFDMYIPSDLANNNQAVSIFRRAQKQMKENLAELEQVTQVDKRSFGLKKRLTSAFRRILGNGLPTNIVITANHRAWRHILEMRTSPAAEEEIHEVMAEVSRQLRNNFPAIYADAIISIDPTNGLEVTEFEHGAN